MKKSLKIGAKITIYSCAGAVISAAIMAVITTVIFMNFVTTLQKKETGTGVMVLESEISAEVSDLEGLNRLLVVQTEGSAILMERMWTRSPKKEDAERIFPRAVLSGSRRVSRLELR